MVYQLGYLQWNADTCIYSGFVLPRVRPYDMRYKPSLSPPPSSSSVVVIIVVDILLPILRR